MGKDATVLEGVRCEKIKSPKSKAPRSKKKNWETRLRKRAQGLDSGEISKPSRRKKRQLEGCFVGGLKNRVSKKKEQKQKRRWGGKEKLSTAILWKKRKSDSKGKGILNLKRILELEYGY